jgi:hypothetical protein
MVRVGDVAAEGEEDAAAGPTARNVQRVDRTIARPKAATAQTVDRTIARPKAATAQTVDRKAAGQ